MRKLLLALAFLALGQPAFAQWQVPNGAVPIGRGTGVVGFNSAAPGSVGQCLLSNGVGVAPTFQACSSGALAFGGRLTPLSGTPNVNIDVISSQNIWYAPAENKGTTVPIYNGTAIAPYSFVSGPTDQVGLNLNLAGSANWAAGTIHDVFVTLNAGVPVLATRLWDAGMSPTTAQITNATLITTGTGPNLWTRASNAFDGTTVRPTSTSAVLFTSNNNQDVNCLGQDWGAGTPQVVSQVRITAPTDNYLFNTGPTSVQFTLYAGNDNANWQIIDVRYVNVNAVGIGGTATIIVNSSYQTPYRYVRMCIRGDGVNNVLVAQLKFDNIVNPAGGRRLIKYGGILTNDASMTARINSTTTITVPTNQGTYLGSIQIDAGGNGAVTAHVTPGPSRVYNVWNVENQIDIIVRAVFNTLAGTGVAGYVYTIPSNTAWTTIQGNSFNVSVLIGYARSPVTANLIRSVYFNAASGVVSGYGAGIGVDTVTNPSGTQCGATVDTTGQSLGESLFCDLVLPPYAGSHLLTAIETLGATSGTFSVFTDLRNTRMQAAWKG